MRVQGITFNNNSYTNYTNKKTAKNPDFQGRGYNYQIFFDQNGVGSTCYVYDENGNQIRTEGRASMYRPSEEGVADLCGKLCGNNRINLIKANPYKTTNQLYIADPEETITPEMYRKYDYIATEIAPEIPTLDELHNKFHAIRGNNRDYNKVINFIKAYYGRMLKADTKEKARYEIKQVEDNINLKDAISYKEKCLAELAERPYMTSLRDEINKQDYYIYANNNALREDKEKLDYYEYKNRATEEKIRFLENLASIINKTGDGLIKRDIAASDLNKHSDYHDENIVNHIETMFDLRVKEEEKNHLEKQLAIINRRNKAFKSQGSVNRKASQMDTRSSKLNPNTYRHYEEVNAMEEKLAKIDAEIAELSKKRHQIQKRIKEENIAVRNATKEVKRIINGMEPIYNELSDYYTNNNPFEK
ncbi:MAG: hypothetical protein VZR09_09470 [Candidatus Gastranaerophilaceae bacterium]|nr:hypothetical protein [Candidatus Gastranaerophilaceae bacterium]